MLYIICAAAIVLVLVGVICVLFKKINILEKYIEYVVNYLNDELKSFREEQQVINDAYKDNFKYLENHVLDREHV